MAPEELLVRLLAKFGLGPWANERDSFSRLGTNLRSVLESALHLLIGLLTERWQVRNSHLLPCPLSPSSGWGRWEAGVGEGVDAAVEVRREFVNALCRGPRPFSKLEKLIPDSPKFARVSPEDVIVQIGPRPSRSPPHQWALMEPHGCSGLQEAVGGSPGAL